MQNNYSFVCGSAFVSPSGEANFTGIFTRIIAAKLPAVHKQFFVVSNIGLDDKDKHKVVIFIKTPSGKNLIEPVQFDVRADQDPPDKAAGVTLQVNNTKFDEEGLYEVIIEVDSKKLHSFQFALKIGNITKS